jgi:hypothetical protein
MKTMINAMLIGLLAFIPVGASAQENEEDIERLPAISVTVEQDRMTDRTPEQIYLDSYARKPVTLYPTSVEFPYINGIYAGKELDLQFMIDDQGRTHDVRVASGVADMGLLTLLTSAIDDWRFSPLIVDGEPVATHAALEVSILSDDPGPNT